MTVETDTGTAIKRVSAEREWTVEKQDALERFADTVQAIDPGYAQTSSPTVGATTAVTQGSQVTSVSAVLDAFDEHLAAYSGDSSDRHESVHEAVAAEFSSDLAIALCGGDSGGVLTTKLKRVVESETERRLNELDVMERTLTRELDSLEAVDDGLTTVCEWFVDHNPTPLTELGFDELRRWHEHIDDHRDRLSELAAARQQHVHATSGGPGKVGIEHRVLVEYLYADFGSTYPALSTIARLDDRCKQAQRSLRSHLTCRV